jgi:topoisomerase-4 subunit A
MQYHPHGDASIGDAMVNLGQKELLIETQGNWGDARTGDDAAAPRYIEARLSKFALDVVHIEQLQQVRPPATQLIPVLLWRLILVAQH